MLVVVKGNLAFFNLSHRSHLHLLFRISGFAFDQVGLNIVIIS